MKRVAASSIFLLLVLTATAQTRSGAPLVPLRVWQFNSMNMEYVSSVMQLAPQYGINTVVYSHGMLWNTMDLYDGNRLNSPYKGVEHGQKLRELAGIARKLGLKVWIWTHELADVPQNFVRDGVVQADMPGFWDWLADRYEKVFTDFPEFDGVVLTLQESQNKIFSETEVASALSGPERIARLINTIDSVCVRHNKDLVVRTFVYEPEELDWVKEGIGLTDPRVIVQSKEVPHDWQPYYPSNPVIGAFPGRRQIVEFDVSSEFTGKNRIPYASPEYFADRWRYALSFPDVVGYVARLDHAGFDALFTPNEINAYTLYRLTEDSTITPGAIWYEWTSQRYGRQAAPYVEQALRPSFEIVNKAFFPLHFWITNHSRLPSLGYAESHISSRSLVKWLPGEPHYTVLEHRLNHPDPEVLEEVLAEKDSALALADEALLYLERAQPFLTAGQYEDLHWRFSLLRRTVLVWRYHAEAFWGYKVLLEGGRVPGLHERVVRAIAALYRQAAVSEKDPHVGDKPPASAREIRQVADELRTKLESL